MRVISLQLWLLLQRDLAPQAAASTPPLYYWVATATAWLTSPILALHDGARLASGLFIALALFFVARAARVLYGAEAGWAAALTLLGTMVINTTLNATVDASRRAVAEATSDVTRGS